MGRKKGSTICKIPVQELRKADFKKILADRVVSDDMSEMQSEELVELIVNICAAFERQKAFELVAIILHRFYDETYGIPFNITEEQ